MNRPIAFGGAVLLAFALSACGVRNAAIMTNPLASGVLQNNESHHRRSWDEARYGVPSRSLTSEASLVSLDHREACFDLRLRYLSEPGAERDGDGYVDLTRLVARLEIEEPEDVLLIDAETEGDVTLAHETVMGRRMEVRTRDRQTCWDTRHGPRCNTVTESYTEPVETAYVASDGAGRVCFEHRGAITPQTKLLILHLSHPAEGHRAAHRFAWKFPS